MLMVCAPGANTKCLTYPDPNTIHEAFPSKRIHVNSLSYASFTPRLCRTSCNCTVQCSFFSWKERFQLNTHYVSHHVASKKWLCQMDDSVPSNDEYRSSRNIAISLLKWYRNVVDRGGGDNLKEFISAGVNAYALGCTDEGLRKELADMKELGIEIKAMQSYGGNTSLKSKISSEETWRRRANLSIGLFRKSLLLRDVRHMDFAACFIWSSGFILTSQYADVMSRVDECILWLSIIFITILCTPQPTVVRWSSTPPVSDEVRLQWKGFCALIANAYYVRGMAWLPVKTLQLEQMAVVGRAEEPSVVASRMQLVFSTLEVVSPQWPRA